MTDDEQRAPDQDAAVEAAFVAGTLPEEDRRAPEPAITASVVNGDVQPLVLDLASNVLTSDIASETKRLLAIAAHDTGYAQADALAALCRLWGVA
jgi:hypothetical protein